MRWPLSGWLGTYFTYLQFWNSYTFFYSSLHLIPFHSLHSCPLLLYLQVKFDRADIKYDRWLINVLGSCCVIQWCYPSWFLSYLFLDHFLSINIILQVSCFKQVVSAFFDALLTFNCHSCTTSPLTLTAAVISSREHNTDRKGSEFNGVSELY